MLQPQNDTLQSQEKHLLKVTHRQELRVLLKRHERVLDQRYLWDQKVC